MKITFSDTQENIDTDKLGDRDACVFETADPMVKAFCDQKIPFYFLAKLENKQAWVGAKYLNPNVDETLELVEYIRQRLLLPLGLTIVPIEDNDEENQSF